MTFIAGVLEPERKSRMTTQDWWDAGIWIAVVLAAVAIGYLIAVKF